MSITVNGERRDPVADLTTLLQSMGLADAIVATAVNGVFVPATQRVSTSLRDGDTVDILAPMQGG